MTSFLLDSFILHYINKNLIIFLCPCLTLLSISLTHTHIQTDAHRKRKGGDERINARLSQTRTAWDRQGQHRAACYRLWTIEMRLPSP